MSKETDELRSILSETFGMTDGEFMVFGGSFCKLFYPVARDIDIRVIEHALSNLCRFNGHTRDFYSVAQHSVLVSQQVPPEHALCGLLHDASEAYLGDVIRPIKYVEAMKIYRQTEEVWQRVIFERFGLDPIMPDSVKLADNRLLITEFRDLFARTPPGLNRAVKPYPHFRIKALDPKDARKLFVDRWKELTDA